MSSIKTEEIDINEISSNVLSDLCRICLVNNNSTDEHNGSNIFEKKLGDVELTYTGDSNMDEDDRNTLLCQALEQLTTATVTNYFNIYSKKIYIFLIRTHSFQDEMIFPS